MKFVLIFFTAIALTQGWTLSPKQRQKLQVTLEGCAEETHLDSENLKAIDRFEFPDTDDAHHFLKCVFDRLGIWENTNGFRNEGLREILDGHRNRNQMVDAMNNCCQQSKQEDPDAWIFDSAVCITNGAIGGEVKRIMRDISEPEFRPKLRMNGEPIKSC